MAFNPLHMFRKRQKTLLAILTIGTMFLFVLGSGTKGDVFSGGWFTGRKSGETYLQNKNGDEFLMNGKRVSASDLSQLRRERRAAHLYAMSAYRSALQKIGSEMESNRKTSPTEVQTDKRQQDLQSQWFDYVQKSQAYGSFAGGIDDLLDFMLWRDEATRLGVAYLSDSDVERILNGMTQNYADLAKAMAEARGSLGRDQTMSEKEVFEALRNEFSVHDAKLALQGYDIAAVDFGMGRRFVYTPWAPATERRDASNLTFSGASTQTPYERFEDFRKNRTSNFFAVLALPVKDFVAEVKEQPTETQLQALFDRYKNTPYSPDSLKPGFMEPRRISLEWVSARPDSPFYRERAHTSLPLLLTFTPFGPASAQEMAVVSEYREQTTGSFLGSTSPYALPPLTDPNFVLPYYTSLNQPENVAPAISLLAAASPLPGPLPAIVSYQGCPAARDAKEQAAVVERESNKRLRIGCSLLLSSADPCTLTVPALWAALSREKQFLPLDVVRKQIERKIESKYAQNLLSQNLAKLQKELESKRFKPKEAREYLAKTLPELGLTEHVVENKPLGQFEIESDPQIQPFREAYLKRFKKTDPNAEQFAGMFFDKDPTGKSVPYAAKEWPNGVLNTQFGFAQGDEEAFLYWKTEEDKPPATPTFEQARPKVEEAWRLNKARDLADKRAEELKKEAQATGGDKQQLKDLAEKYHLNYTELGPVARLVSQLAAQANDPGMTYKRFEFPPDALAHSGPATQDEVLDKLLAVQKLGDAVVYANQPRDQFYIATVYLRSEQSVDNFYRAYRDSTGPAVIKDHLFDTLDQQRLGELHQKLLKELRSRVASVDDKGRYNLDETQKSDIEKRMNSSRGE